MNIEIQGFYDGVDEWQQSVAKYVSDYTNGKMDESPQMLPVSQEEITKKYDAYTAKYNKQFAGYIAATNPCVAHGQNMSEVGTLLVPKIYRGHGIAKMLVTVIRDALLTQDIVPCAFCNPLSIGVFKAAGFVVATLADIPESAFEPCSLCPCKPLGGGCCDTPVVYKGVV